MRVKGAIEVRSGLIPGTADDTKVWTYSEADCAKDKETPQDQPTIFCKIRDEAIEYMKTKIDPRQSNWVDMNWVWY